MAQRKRNTDPKDRPGQAPADRDTHPRGEFEHPAAPESTNRDHPGPAGLYISEPGAGKVSPETVIPAGPSEGASAVPEFSAEEERDAGSSPLTPVDPAGSSESAGPAAAETNDPNFTAAHMGRSISHRDAGRPRMDTSGRVAGPDAPIATHSRDPQLVRDVMTADMEVCNPETELYYVARMMMERDCGSIPVVESTNTMRPVGIVTDRDIVVRCIAQDANPLTERARDCMSTELITIAADASFKQCVKQMEQCQVRRMLVVDNTGRLCGIVSQADVVGASDEHVAAELVKEVSEPLGQVPPT